MTKKKKLGIKANFKRWATGQAQRLAVHQKPKFNFYLRLAEAMQLKAPFGADNGRAADALKLIYWEHLPAKPHPTWETKPPPFAAEAAQLQAQKDKRKRLDLQVKAETAREQRAKADPNSAEFLKSYAWRQLRMKVLQRNGRRCRCCGATPADGVTINVDHIKPRRTHPQLAWDENNLQVLCGACNHGKGNQTIAFDELPSIDQRPC